MREKFLHLLVTKMSQIFWLCWGGSWESMQGRHNHHHMVIENDSSELVLSVSGFEPEWFARELDENRALYQQLVDAARGIQRAVDRPWSNEVRVCCKEVRTDGTDMSVPSEVTFTVDIFVLFYSSAQRRALNFIKHTIHCKKQS